MTFNFFYITSDQILILNTLLTYINTTKKEEKHNKKL